MHNAPSVSFPVGRSRFQGWLIGLLVGLGALTVFTWTVQADGLGWRQWLAASLCVTTSAWSARSWWRTPVGSVSWDGVVWRWTAGAQSVVMVPEVVLDLQFAILLRLPVTADTGVNWLWLDRASNSLRWIALRRAIYSLARRRDDPFAEPANSPSVGAAP
jgi:hypothetical protein